MLSGTGVPCVTESCRCGRDGLSNARTTTTLKCSPTVIFGAVIAGNSEANPVVFYLPSSGRLSLGTTTQVDGGGGLRVVRMGSLPTLAKCMENKYSPVKVGGRFSACVSDSYLFRRRVDVDTNRQNRRVLLSTETLVSFVRTAATSVAQATSSRL